MLFPPRLLTAVHECDEDHEDEDVEEGHDHQNQQIKQVPEQFLLLREHCPSIKEKKEGSQYQPL